MNKLEVNLMLDAALSYAARGWRVFPLHSVTDAGACTCPEGAKCPDAGKHPATPCGVKDATTDAAKINAWFATPKFNIGIRTGKASALTVLDIDTGEKGGDVTWNALVREHGEPNTPMVLTGGGGFHFYLKYNSAMKSKNGLFGVGLDCKSDGGYVVAPPSRHKSGARYEWSTDDGVPLDDLPAWLAAAAMDSKHLSKKKDARGRPKKGDPTRRKYSIEEVQDMLVVIPADDRDLWRDIGIILGREYNRAAAAWDVYAEWSAKWGGTKGRNHDQIMNEAFHQLSQQDGDLSMGTLVMAAIDNGWTPKEGDTPIELFYWFAPDNDYLYLPTGARWPAASVNASCSKVNDGSNLVAPADWLRTHRKLTSMTFSPKMPRVIPGFDCAAAGELVPTVGATTFNDYRPPTIVPGDAALAAPFLDHVHNVFRKPGDAEQFLDYMAHRIQNPGEKPRFGLLLAGQQGVGKDTAISMCYPAIGQWNIAGIDPGDLDLAYNEYASRVLVIISEAANSGDMSKWAFNERTKVLIAGNPDHVTINPKYGKQFVTIRCNGTIITTNHMLSGLYIPPDDRRYDVIDCATLLEMGLADAVARADYFARLWAWFNEQDGARHIYAYLLERDISKFRAATGQRITDAHREVVAVGFSGDEWVADSLLALGEPDVVRADAVMSAAMAVMGQEYNPKELRARLQHAMTRQGYAKLTCRTSKDGRWRLKMDGAWMNVAVYFRPEKIDYAEAARVVPKLGVKF